MTTKDLCVGNWVTNENGFPMFVQAIYDDDTIYLDFEGNEGDTWETDIEDVKPIKVTEEILSKQSFSENQSLGMQCFEKILGDYHISIFNREYLGKKGWNAYVETRNFDSVGNFNFEYLHELQNIVRLATGKDLEVKI